MNTTVFGIIVTLIYSALIAGLVKPSLILRWSPKPTRLKVLGLWLASIFIVPVLAVFIDEQELTADRIEIAAENIANEKYEEALNSLKTIKEDDPLYSKAQELIANADSLNNIIIAELQAANEAEEKLKLEEVRLQQVEQLNRELKSIKEGVDFSSYRNSVESLQIELILFGTWATLINESESSDDKEVKRLGTELKTRVSKIQATEFPILRKNYTKVVSKLMWENDITVTSTGSGSKYINFLGGIFAANRNKQDFQEQVQEALRMFRFNQSRYRWYKGADEYTYYTNFEGSDRDLVTFK